MPGMSLLCLFGRHRPSLHSVARSRNGYSALCEACARPLERGGDTPWRASAPLDGQPGKAA